VFGRVGLGIIAAIIIGVTFAVKPSKEVALSGQSAQRQLLCDCVWDGTNPVNISGKFKLFIRHAQSEFWSVGKHLAIGCFIAAAFQVFGSADYLADTGGGLVVSLIVMMAMSFLLSLCSSSDAVVARSFVNRLPGGAIMGFLVFGPMMDVKNVLMLGSGLFTRRFICRLAITVFIVCFTVVFAAYQFGLFS
jgi:uncharacterized membrane protein YraQ (UPF0718 family)